MTFEGRQTEEASDPYKYAVPFAFLLSPLHLLGDFPKSSLEESPPFTVVFAFVMHCRRT